MNRRTAEGFFKWRGGLASTRKTDGAILILRPFGPSRTPITNSFTAASKLAAEQGGEEINRKRFLPLHVRKHSSYLAKVTCSGTCLGPPKEFSVTINIGDRVQEGVSGGSSSRSPFRLACETTGRLPTPDLECG